MNHRYARNAGITTTDDFMALEDLSQIQKISSVQPINLDYCGEEQCKSNYAFGPFVRTSYVLHMVMKGKGKLYKNGKVYEIQAGEAFLIYPKEETVYQADSEQPWHYMWIGFHGFSADEFMERAGFLPEHPVRVCQDMPQIRQAMGRMLDAGGLSYSNELMRMSSLYHVLALLTKDQEEPAVSKSAQDSSSDAHYVRTAINLLLDSYKQGIRVDEVARAIGISRNYLTTIFKKEMNVSPQEFLMNYRMEKAGSLLLSTSELVSTIAYEVGYSDALSFSRAFRRHYGVSPSEYRLTGPIIIQKQTKGDYTSNIPL